LDNNLPEQNQAGQDNIQPNTPPQSGDLVYPNTPPASAGNPQPTPVNPGPEKGAAEIFGETSSTEGSTSSKPSYNPLSQFSQSVAFNRDGQAVTPDPIEEPDTSHVGKRPSKLKTALWATATIAGVIALVGGITFTLLKNSSPKPSSGQRYSIFQLHRPNGHIG
jgi:hypothetical protein